MRIISVVPSLTELLFDLKLGSQVVGVTKFCIHPKDKTASITKIGGTKSLKIDKIIALKPDIIIANKEENEKRDIDELQKHCTVWLTDILTINDALEVIKELGKKTNSESEADLIVEKIKLGFSQVSQVVNQHKNKVAYLIWKEPIMAAGRLTFINDMLINLGLVNVIDDDKSRYPVLSLEKLKVLNPSYVFLSSEPYPFKNKNKLEFQKQLPNSQVILVDGEMFSWYGSRMALAPKYFNQVIETLNQTND